jgi:hypothetical protein
MNNLETISILLEVQYLAPVQYYSKFLKYDKILIEQKEHYSKGSFRNRCQITMSDGIHGLSIPLSKGKNQQTDIREVRIDYSQNWQQTHFRSIKTAYGSAPFYEYYEPYLAVFYEKKTEFLFDFCLEMQQQICNLLKIKPSIDFTETYITDYTESAVLDFRNKICPRNYANSSDSDPHFNPTRYPQIFEERQGFIPNLSILDLLFCTGPEAQSYLKQSNK